MAAPARHIIRGGDVRGESYHLVIVYWRSAYAELLAAALLPILLLRILRLNETGFRHMLYLGITLAASWLTNAPAAVMIHYSAAGLALLMAFWSVRGVLCGAPRSPSCWERVWRRSILCRLCETRWVNIDQVLAPGLRPQDNFLFTKIPDAEHNQFNLLVSTVAAVEIEILLLAIWYSQRWRLDRETAG